MPRSREDGASVVEFTLVTLLLLVLFLVVVQVGLALHTRNVLVAAAAEGARYGANADRTDEDGAARAAEVVADALPDLPGVLARAVDRSSTPDPDVVDIEVAAELPLLLLPGSPLRLTVHGHALDEGR